MSPSEAFLVVQVGALSVLPAKALPEHLQRIVEDAQSLVYVSMGTRCVPLQRSEVPMLG